MKYKNVCKGVFQSRPNRFVAHVDVGNESIVCHVKNTGRCRELLLPGTVVYLEKSDNPNRKTQFDLIVVEKGNKLINMDSQIPNKVIEEWLKKGNLVPKDSVIRPETKYGNSRFDFYVVSGERRIFIEVKGVTLENEKIAAFPDAPTLRGVKHMVELSKCVEDGYEAYIIFVIQMSDIHKFCPNWKTHPEFAETLCRVQKEGVHVLAYDCIVTEDTIKIANEVPVSLNRNEVGIC